MNGPAPLLLNSTEDAFFGFLTVSLAVQQIWMLMTGKLIPGKTVDRLVKAKDEEVIEKQKTINQLVDLLDKQSVTGQASIVAAQASIVAARSIQEMP